MNAIAHHIQARSSLEVKTQLRFHPVSLSLTMVVLSTFTNHYGLQIFFDGLKIIFFKYKNKVFCTFHSGKPGDRGREVCNDARKARSRVCTS
jgi:hypothetical protein